MDGLIDGMGAAGWAQGHKGYVTVRYSIVQHRTGHQSVGKASSGADCLLQDQIGQ